jgi:hypothetical protein
MGVIFFQNSVFQIYVYSDISKYDTFNILSSVTPKNAPVLYSNLANVEQY